MDSSTWRSDTSENVFFFVFIVLFHHWFPLEHWFLFLASPWPECYPTISAVDVIFTSKYASREGAWCFNLWKAFSENSRPIMVCYGLFTKIPKLIVVHDFFGEFIQTQERYPTYINKMSILTWRLLVIWN